MCQSEWLAGRVVSTSEPQHACLVSGSNRLTRPRPADLDEVLAAGITPDARGVAAQLTSRGRIAADVHEGQSFELGPPDVAVHERRVVADPQLALPRKLDHGWQNVDVIGVCTQMQRGLSVGRPGQP